MESFIYPRKSLAQLIAELQQIPNPETVGVAFPDDLGQPRLIYKNDEIEHNTEDYTEFTEWSQSENPDGFTSFMFFR